MFEFEDVVPAVVIPSSGKKVSYSQYSMFLKCKYQWYLSYVKGLRKYENSIHTIFGTAMHEVLQEYVRLLYTDGAPVADSYDAIGEFTKKITQLLIESNKDKKVIDETLLPEFLKDGEDIIKWFTKQANRSKYFPSKAYSIVGIELPLEIDLKNNLKYIGFLDVVLQDTITKNIKIIDFKTSSFGWREYAKKDKTKTDQILLYKKFYSDKFNIPLDKIEIEFLILKRKLTEGMEYAQSRVAAFEPPNGTTSIKNTMLTFDAFLDAGFTKDGTHNKEHKFPKVPGKAKSNCKYCDFFKTEFCDSKAD
jgi:hypothetical protein